MMLAVSFVFIMLWLPQVVMQFLHSDAHSNPCESNVYATSFANICTFTNSAINFFLYCMTVDKFRIAAWQLIRCQLFGSRQKIISPNGTHEFYVASKNAGILNNLRIVWGRVVESNETNSGNQDST